MRIGTALTGYIYAGDVDLRLHINDIKAIRTCCDQLAVSVELVKFLVDLALGIKH